MTVTVFEDALDHIRASPADGGTVELIVRRPATDEREELDEGTLTVAGGLVGDKWATGRRPNRDAQLTLMNARVAALVAGAPERRALAGDQLYVDLDLSEGNLPAGTRLAVGEAVVEVTALPHLGCRRFAARYGAEAQEFVNSPEGRALRLRGLNARVAEPGVVRVGDTVTRVA